MYGSRMWTATGIGAAVLVTLAGCGGSGGPAPAAQSMTQAGGSTAATAAPPVRSEAGPCRVDDLTAELQERPSNDSARRAVVIWTNESDRECRMTGFGGVDLRGPDDPTFGPVYSLPRSSDTPDTVTLAPQGRAETPIVVLPPSDGTPGWTPTEIVATPPDETRSVTLPWTLGPVLRQDGATRPGTYLQPVVPSVR